VTTIKKKRNKGRGRSTQCEIDVVDVCHPGASWFALLLQTKKASKGAVRDCGSLRRCDDHEDI